MLERGKKRAAPSHDLFIHRFEVVVVPVEPTRPGPHVEGFPRKRYDTLPEVNPRPQ